MKYITLISAIAIILLEFSGAVPRSSVGGPMTIMLVFLVAALAVGVHEAWSKGRGVLGWIVSLVVAVVGAFVAANFGAMLMDAILTQVAMEGTLADTQRPLFYVASVAMLLITLLGSWCALWAVNRLR